MRWQQQSVYQTSNQQTPYPTLTGELYGVYHENFEENWPRYNGTALYHTSVDLTTCETQHNVYSLENHLSTFKRIKPLDGIYKYAAE